jgi:hypothetical protein
MCRKQHTRDRAARKEHSQLSNTELQKAKDPNKFTIDMSLPSRTRPREKGVPLTRHPQPCLWMESLRGYELRVAEANGYDSPWAIHLHAGMKQSEARGAGFKAAKLALICNCSQSDLQTIAYSDSENPRSCRLLGEPVGLVDLEHNHPKICPECVRQLGYIQGPWDLRFMVGCPVHGVQALSECSNCNEPLSWFRPAMLTCRCGAILESTNLAPLAPCERALLDLIYSKALNLIPFPDSNGHLPILELSQMRLRMLLRATGTIGSCWAVTMAPNSNAADPRQIIQSAARAFSDWPDNYFRLLASLAARPIGGEYDVRRQFSPLYNALLKERKGADSGSLALFRAAFMEFIGGHQAVRAADPRLMPQVQAQFPKRYQSRAEIARSLRVDPRTVGRLLTPDVESESGGRFVAVDSMGLALTGTKAARILSVRKAAAKLGVPVSVFRGLVDSRLCPIRHRLPKQLGYDERDLNHFLSRLLDKAETTSQKEREVASVSFDWVMQMIRYSVGEKIAIIAAIERGGLKVFTRKPGSDIRSIRMTIASLTELITCERAKSQTVTASQASATIGCSMETIKGLIGLGRLLGKKSGQRWRVSRPSLDSFIEHHVKLSTVAIDFGTSSRRLMSLCLAVRLPLTYVRSSKRRQEVFVARDLQARLKASFLASGVRRA